MENSLVKKFFGNKKGVDLTMVPDNLSTDQKLRILQRTPAKFIKKRPGKGGMEVDYVEGGYVKKTLNYIFGFTGWSFEILDHGSYGEDESVWVKGRLTLKVRDNKTGKLVDIIKEQFGSKDVARLKDSKEVISYGDDLKAAATDALKKCASEIGIASDVYSPDLFKDVDVKKINS